DLYNMGGAQIQDLELNIRWKDNQPAVVSREVNGTTIPLIETLGLDNKDESTGNAINGHDGKVDGTRANSFIRPVIDYTNGILFFPELRPFAPSLGAATGPFDRA